jgi:ribosomal protein S18 acetylase RimI-like enzyme
MSRPVVREARASDASWIAGHVNGCYRGDSSRQGWTTEADLLDGNRTDPQEIADLVEGQESVILLCLEQEALLASVHLKRSGDAAELGMLSVVPTRQGEGVGKWLLAESERYIRQRWGSHKIVMTVITTREELISFYQRRGFERTGALKPFNLDPRNGIPRQPLQFEVLEKRLT